MHILLTDLLTCPRCGPEFGLIVLADAVEDRDVREGRLGCANCREEYPIREGAADLRAGTVPLEAAPGAPEEEGTGMSDRALRGAALLGLAETGGAAMVLAGDPELVEGIRDLLPQARVIGASPAPPADPSTDWVLVGSRLPVRTGSLDGVMIAAGAAAPDAGELLRALAPGARLVLESAGARTPDGMLAAGFELLLDQGGIVVASRPGGR